MITKAEENANNIEQYLKTNYPNMWVKKITLKVLFRMPYNQAAEVWEILRQRGLKVDYYNVKYLLKASQV